MRAFVNGDETELDPSLVKVARVNDRLLVTGPEGTFSAVAVRLGDAILVSYRGQQFRIEARQPRTSSRAQGGSGDLRAPMPGQIVDVRKHVGESVKKGDVILVLEAMKTQQPFAASFDGVVAKLEVEKGAQVSDGQLLAAIQPAETPHE